jgi:hypothetical protein
MVANRDANCRRAWSQLPDLGSMYMASLLPLRKHVGEQNPIYYMGTILAQTAQAWQKTIVLAPSAVKTSG